VGTLRAPSQAIGELESEIVAEDDLDGDSPQNIASNSQTRPNAPDHNANLANFLSEWFSLFLFLMLFCSDPELKWKLFHPKNFSFNFSFSSILKLSWLHWLISPSNNRQNSIPARVRRTVNEKYSFEMKDSFHLDWSHSLTNSGRKGELTEEGKWVSSSRGISKPEEERWNRFSRERGRKNGMSFQPQVNVQC